MKLRRMFATTSAPIESPSEEQIPWFFNITTTERREKDVNDDGNNVHAHLKRLLTYELPSDEQLNAERLQAPSKNRFSHAENVLFQYMLDTYTERQRFCMGDSTKNKIDWTKFHDRFNENCRVLVIRSRNGDKMPFGRAELFDRSLDALCQKRKDMMRRNKNNM